MELQIFNSEFGKVRAMMIDGEPFFVGKDVAEALGYTNPLKAIRDHVDEDDKGVNETFTPGGKQNLICINESGVYSLVFASKLPTAKKFKHWVTSEVLPAIRKHGAYMTEQTIEKALTSPEFLIQLANQLKDEKDKNMVLQAKNEEMQPKAVFADAVASSKTSILIGELAKLLKQNGVETGQIRLFRWMREQKYLMSDNMPTQRSMEMKLFEVKERTIHKPDGSIRITRTTMVTGKGQQYFINKFLDGTMKVVCA